MFQTAFLCLCCGLFVQPGDEYGLDGVHPVFGLVENDAVSKAILTIGCASWDAGQLERELEENSWLAVPADGNILFDLPFHERYRAALAKLGIEPVMLMREAGHA